MIGKLKCQDRFRATVLIAAARGHTIATTSIGRIGKDRAAVVCSKDPGVSGASPIDPDATFGGMVCRTGCLDCRLRFEWLLIERQMRRNLPEAFGADRAEISVRGCLPGPDPFECLETDPNPFRTTQYLSRFDERLRQARIVIGEDRFKPRPVRTTCSQKEPMQ